MTDPPRPAPGSWADAPSDKPRPEAVTLVAPDEGVVEGILWTPPSGRWRTAVVLTHDPDDRTAQVTCSLLAAAGLAVLAIADRADGRADLETAVAHLRGLGGENVVVLEAPSLPPAAGPVLAADEAREPQHPAARTEERGGRGRVLVIAAGVGVVVGIGLTVATGVLVWPLLGAVTGIGVGDLLAGGRR